MPETAGERRGQEQSENAGPSEEPEYAGPATRIVLRPHDPQTGEEIDRDEVRKGYEYERGQFVTFSSDELKALDIESSRTIDLSTFVPRFDVDPLYFSTPYYLYPDGAVAIEPYRVISAAMAEAGMAALGRLTLSRRERMAMVEPRGPGMVLMTLRAAEEVRPAELRFDDAAQEPEAVAIAEMIIKRKSGAFDPTTFRDRYQDALRELIEAKMKGLPIKARPTAPPAPVFDLMAALKRSLAQEGREPVRKPRRKTSSLLLPVKGGGHEQAQSTAGRSASTRRRKA